MIRSLLRSRKYKSGTGWCVWRWTEVATDYILRLHVIKTPWFAICLHWLNTPDPDPHLHDHPVSFLSLILRGGYSEFRSDAGASVVAKKHHRGWNFIRSSTRHRIVTVKPGTVTLCFMGPKTQEWGFYVPCRGKVYWKTYYAEQRAAEVKP
jgi:hypothetical protein